MDYDEHDENVPLELDGVIIDEEKDKLENEFGITDEFGNPVPEEVLEVEDEEEVI